MDVQDDVARRRSRAVRTAIDPARVAARCRGQRGCSARPSASSPTLGRSLELDTFGGFKWRHTHVVLRARGSPGGGDHGDRA